MLSRFRRNPGIMESIVKRTIHNSGVIAMKNNETRDGGTPEPPDKPPEAAGGTQCEEEEENAELEWARWHIREEPAAKKTAPARAQEQIAEPEPEEDPEIPELIRQMKNGRGKGRPPHRMLKEAIATAKKRGDLILVPGGRSRAFDLIICEKLRNVYVRLRWSGTPYLSTRDVIERYYSDIRRMGRLPLTAVMAWELWLREPQDLWQFFLLTHDSLVEIRDDGTIWYRPVLPVPVADEAGNSADDGGNGGRDESSPDTDH